MYRFIIVFVCPSLTAIFFRFDTHSGPKTTSLVIIRHSYHFYSASSSPLLLISAPDTARILCRSFTSKRHKQLQVKDLPMVPTMSWRLDRDSNPRPFS